MPLLSDEQFLLFNQQLFDLVTTGDITDNPALTWTGEPTVVTVESKSRLAWRLTNRDGSDPRIPQQGAIGIYDATDGLVDMVPVSLEQGDTTDPLLWADYQWAKGGPFQARIVVSFTDLSTDAAMIEV